MSGNSQARPAAVVFDMDGVLADTEPVQEEALAAFLRPLGRSLSAADYAATMGLDRRAFWGFVIGQYGLELSVEDCVRDYEAVLLPRLVGLSAAPGVVELVGALLAADVPLAVASSSLSPVVEKTLGAIGLREAFKVVVSGEEVDEGKPAPEIYLLAAKLLGVEATRCVAIEDSPSGVRAALAAGMACLGIASTYFMPDQLGATRTVGSLTEVGLADLAALIA